MNFNKVLNDSATFYYNEDSKGNTCVFLQDIYYSGNLGNEIYNRLTDEEKSKEATATLDIQGSAVRILNDKGQTVPYLATPCSLIANIVGTQTLNSILATTGTSTTTNNFYIDTMNYNVSADANYDYINCSILDDGANGTTADTSTAFDPDVKNQSRTTTIIVGVIIGCLALTVLPALIQLVQQKVHLKLFDINTKRDPPDDSDKYPADTPFEKHYGIFIVLVPILFVGIVLIIIGATTKDKTEHKATLAVGIIFMIIAILSFGLQWSKNRKVEAGADAKRI